MAPAVRTESFAEETPLEPANPIGPSLLDGRRNGRCRKRLLHLLDNIFSLVVISPLVVAHWRGTWGWMDLNGPHFPAWLCFVLGATLHTTFAFLREPLNTALALGRDAPKSRWRSIQQWLINRMYTYAFSMGCLMHWRGGWMVMESYFALHLLPALSVSAICLVGLVLSKSVRNLLAPPFIILTDRKEAMFSFPTRFRMKVNILNNIYAALIISPLVICYWRGIWNLMDKLLFPEDEVLRMITLIGFGNGGHLLFLLLQTKLQRWFDVDKHPVVFYISSRVYTFIYGAVCVSTWRGGWILIDRYSPPSLMFFIEASLVALLLLGSLRSFCNVAGAPFINDLPDGYFAIPTYFKSKSHHIRERPGSGVPVKASSPIRSETSRFGINDTDVASNTAENHLLWSQGHCSADVSGVKALKVRVGR
ncbi:uncharacterized protein LOC128723972 [Anopheles nili]|uniref:uncharacterized protein LOC128723972 n=1 Tax=Anopheles nili TaxID=185578 RepID=UPI00237BB61F|nr:uncharacterized protein LOC128723972 [Anopheles nili]